MNDWRLLGLALAFVYLMARLKNVNRQAMKFGGLLVLALAGYKTVPLLAPMFTPLPERAAPQVVELGDTGLPFSEDDLGANATKVIIQPDGWTPGQSGETPAAPVITAVSHASSGEGLVVYLNYPDTATHGSFDSADFEVDTFGGSFGEGSQYLDATIGPILFDSASITGDSGAVVTVRARQKLGGTWSAWDTVPSVTMRGLTFFSDFTGLGLANDSMLRHGAALDSAKWSDLQADNCLVQIAAGRRTCGVVMNTADTLWNPLDGLVQLKRDTYHAANADSGGIIRHILNQGAAWSALSVGQTLFHRVYTMNRFVNWDTTNSGFDNPPIGGHHPYQGTGSGTDFVNGGTTSCAFHWEHKFGPKNLDSTRDLTWLFWLNQNAGGQWSYELEMDTVYRIETKYHKVAADSYTVALKLNGLDWNDSLGISPTDTFAIDDACLTGIYIGNNDNGNWRVSDGGDPRNTLWYPGGPYPYEDFQYWGAPAFDVTNDSSAWIGPYAQTSN